MVFMIVIVFGLPGAGKSYFADRLAARMEADYINSDRVRMKMPGSRTYSENEKLFVYDKMLARVQQSIVQNKTLVLDATFYKDAIRKKFMKDAGNNILFIEVKADEPVIKERLKQKRVNSEADFDVYKLIQSQFEPMKEPHLILYSTDDNITDMINKAMNYLKVTDDEGSN
jgi:predicted kinase